MNLINKIAAIVKSKDSFIINIMILLIITRLAFLETSQLALIAEIISGLIVLIYNAGVPEENNEEEYDE